MIYAPTPQSPRLQQWPVLLSFSASHPVCLPSHSFSFPGALTDEFSFDSTAGDQLHWSSGAHTDEVDLSRPQEAHNPSSRALIKILRYCRFPGRKRSSKKSLLKIEWEECLIRVSFLLKSDYIAALTPPHSLQLWNLFWPFLSPCGLGFYLASSGEWGDWQQRWWKTYKAKCVGT